MIDVRYQLTVDVNGDGIDHGSNLTGVDSRILRLWVDKVESGDARRQLFRGDSAVEACRRDIQKRTVTITRTLRETLRPHLDVKKYECISKL